MEVGLLPTLNAQLLRLDRSYGADALSTDFVNALLVALENYEGSRRPVDLMIEFMNLYDLLLACRPRMANLILDLQKLVFFIRANPNASLERIQRKLKQLLILKMVRTRRSVKAGLALFDVPRTVLVHSLSSSVLSLLDHAKTLPTPPRVIVASQEQYKTDTLIAHLKRQQYSFSVISEYAVSHALKEIDLAIFGGLTLNDAGQIVMGPGSGSLIAQLAHFRIPTYVMLTENKFSYWKESIAPAYREIRAKTIAGDTYEKIVYSHDTVPLDLFTGLISQRAIHTPEQVRDLFAKGQEEYFRQEAAIRDLRHQSG